MAHHPNNFKFLISSAALAFWPEEERKTFSTSYKHVFFNGCKKSNKSSRTNLGKHARTSEVDCEVHEIAHTWEGFSFLIERSFCWSCRTLCECLRFAGWGKLNVYESNKQTEFDQDDDDDDDALQARVWRKSNDGLRYKCNEINPITALW